MIEKNTIYPFEKFRSLILEQMQMGKYYLMYDDKYFEKITNNRVMTRDIFSEIRKHTSKNEKIEYLLFKVDNDYTTSEMSDFLKLLRKNIDILLAVFDDKKKECFLLFTNQKNENIEEDIETLLGMEENEDGV